MMAGRDFYTFLGDSGYTGVFEERARQFLIAQIDAGGGSVDPELSYNDLWMALGELTYPTAGTMNEIMIEVAAALGVPRGSLNDMYNNW